MRFSFRYLSRRPRLLFFVFIFALVASNFVLAITESATLGARVCNVVLPVSFFWFTMSLFRNPGRGLWAHFWVVFLNAFQLVLVMLFGKGQIAVDMYLNLANTNPTEVGEVLFSLLFCMVPMLAFYLLVLYLATRSWRKRQVLEAAFLQKHRRHSAIALLLSISLSVVVFNMDRDTRFDYDIFPVNVTYNAVQAVMRTVHVNRYAQTSQAYRTDAHCLRPDTASEVCVYIIGETARAANFSLYGYERDTNPCLSRRADSLVVFRDATSQANTTHKSVPMLLSEADAHSFSRVHEMKGIFTPMRQAGFRTAFISGQHFNKSYIGFFAQEADTAVYVNAGIQPGDDTFDEKILPVLRAELARPEAKKFIILHTYGSHFAYHQRYPRSEAHFMPDSASRLSLANKAPLVNAYDNSLRYTDWFIDRVIAELEATGQRASMLYLSDHGEDLYDDSRQIFLHATPLPSYYQIHVPLLVWLSRAYRQSYPQVYDALLANSGKPVSTHQMSFPTLLGLTGVAATAADTTQSIASHGFTIRPRFYLSDRNEAQPLTKCGLEPEDFAQFKQRGLVCE